MSMDATKYKPYPAYKESGVEWLGEVPGHWAVKRLSWLFELISSGTTPPSDDQSNYGGDIPWVTTGELREETILDTEKKLTELALKKYSALKIYPPGTLLIALYGATIGRLGILGISACTNQACCALVDPIFVSSNFTFYVLYAAKRYLLLISSGGGQPNINQDKIRSLRIAVPPVEEQQTIAAFLDRETAKIDTLIAKQERLIELLGEKRTALISHAVTKGLNPDTPMKDSGVEWLGQVPEHWEVSRLGYESWVRARLGWKGLKAEEYVDDGFVFLATPNIKNTNIDFENVNYINQYRYNESPEIKLSIGDVLLAKDGSTLGTVNVVRLLPRPATVNSSIAVITPNVTLNSIFLYYLFQSSYMENTIQIIKGGMGVPHLFQEDLNKFYFPLPTIEDQKDIASFLDRETAKIDTLIAKARRALDLLKERRTALVSATVTGKIDVREPPKP